MSLIECEGGIEKSEDHHWHHRACRMMTNRHPEGQFSFPPSQNNGFSFLLTIQFHIFIAKCKQEVSEYAKMLHYI